MPLNIARLPRGRTRIKAFGSLQLRMLMTFYPSNPSKDRYAANMQTYRNLSSCIDIVLNESNFDFLSAALINITIN